MEMNGEALAYLAELARQGSGYAADGRAHPLGAGRALLDCQV